MQQFIISSNIWAISNKANSCGKNNSNCCKQLLKSNNNSSTMNNNCLFTSTTESGSTRFTNSAIGPVVKVCNNYATNCKLSSPCPVCGGFRASYQQHDAQKQLDDVLLVLQKQVSNCQQHYQQQQLTVVPLTRNNR